MNRLISAVQIALLMLSLMFLSGCTPEQEINPITTQDAYPLLCSWAGGATGSGLSPASTYAITTVNNICAALSFPRVPTYSGGVPNAAATELNGSAIIVYNPDFLNSMGSINTYAPICVLAHEVGHHVNFDISYYGQFIHPWTKELQADYISGVALRRMGVSLDDALEGQIIYFQQIGSQTHPDSYQRIDAITAGWSNGQ